MLCNRNLEAIVGKHPGGTGIRKTIQNQNKHLFQNKNGQHDLMLIKIDNTDTTTFRTIPLPNRNNCISPTAQERVDVFGWMTATVDPVTRLKSGYDPFAPSFL